MDPHPDAVPDASPYGAGKAREEPGTRAAAATLPKLRGPPGIWKIRRNSVKHRALPLGLLFTFAVWGCAKPSLNSYQPKNQDEAQIVTSLMRIPNGINARSLEMLMQPYADDVYVGNFQKYMGVADRTSASSISKADLRAAYVQLFRSVKDVSMDVKDFQLTLAGDRAVVEARTELLYKNEAGRGEKKKGEVIVNDVTWRMRRTPLGWKIVEEIWR
jgi:ketosteroid isomerase-like protein